MSKMKQIAALTAMLVGVIMYASPAKSAVCFLPDDDGSCGGGDIEISDDSTSENQCADFNLSQNQRNSKEYDSDCYSCEPCTYNSRTTYKCALKNGATWYGGNLSVCCTGGEKYDSAEGKCCPAEGCVHNCPEGQSWNSSAKSCKCDNGKDADGGICCADSEHVSDGICCPEKKHNDGGVCKCDSQYNTDDDGNCVLPVEKNCSDINIFYMNKEQAKQCNKKAVPLNVVGSDGQCYTCKDKPVDENCEIKGGCIIDMASIGHNSSSGTIGTGDNTEITYTCYITKAENATEADLQKIYGIMYSDFNCQSSMGQIMSSGYQRVGDVINLSSSPVSGKFTVGELTRLANCQGNTAEYNWDTKIELHNETDHCNFTEEIFTKTCKQLGYINRNNSCSSNDLVKTLVENVIGTDGQCYTCEKAQTCSDYDKTYIETSSIKDNDPEDICPYLYSPVFGYVKNLGNGNTDLKVGEYKFKFGGGDNAEFVDASVEGCTACRWKTCEEIDSDFGNSSLDCLPGYDATPLSYNWAVGSDGRCYECVKQQTIIEFEYYVPSVDGAGDYCPNWSISDRNAAEWEARLYSGEYAYDLNYNDFVLPFDMEIVTKYKIPYVDRGDNCRRDPITSWPNEPPVTVTLTIPKGSKLSSLFHAKAIDYSGSQAVIERKFYIDGVERETYTIGDITYQFQEI